MPSDLQDWQSASVQPAVHLQTVSVQANGSQTTTLSLPAGTHGIGLVSPDSSGRIGVQHVVGHLTGNFYWIPVVGTTASLLGTMVVLPIAFDPSYEAQVDVLLNSVYPTGSHPVDVFAILDVEQLVTSGADPVDVSIQSTMTLPVNIVGVNSLLGQNAMSSSASVTVASDQTAVPVQLATFQPQRAVNVRAPTSSGRVDQIGMTSAADVALITLSPADPVLFSIRLTVVNTASAGGVWYSLRLHGVTSGKDIQLIDDLADKNGSGFPYRSQHMWEWLDGRDLHAISGVSETWQIIIHALSGGGFCGCVATWG